VRKVLGQSVALAIACLVSYALTAQLLARAYAVSRSDDLLGGLWAVIATIFVFRFSSEQSIAAAVSRMAATLLSFALCLVYLVVLPFSVWGLAVLIGVGALVMTLVGRPGDVITTGITTAVVLVAAALEPQHAWQQPILRLVDTLAGVVVGVAAAWLSQQSMAEHRRQHTARG
jgi:uncharacterized membrane protein YccC